MTDMNNTFDDNWSDLAAEFGIDAPKPVAPPIEEPDTEPDIDAAPLDLGDAMFGDGVLLDATETGSDTEVIELGSETDAESATDDESGEKKRRRRRRRKGRKGDAPESMDDATDSRESSQATDDMSAQPSELLKDILSNWDVPSWDDIVAGLHRPNR
jgi:hypothetical protein